MNPRELVQALAALASDHGYALTDCTLREVTADFAVTHRMAMHGPESADTLAAQYPNPSRRMLRE